MPHSYLAVYVHLVFSTRERQPMIARAQYRPLARYLAGIADHHRMKTLAVGPMPEHIHILLSLAPEIGTAKAVNLLKSNSSRWMRQHTPRFSWQEGYGAFSVSVSAIDSVIAYIENQEAHHGKRKFEDEFVALLKRHGVAYDPHWVFG